MKIAEKFEALSKEIQYPNEKMPRAIFIEAKKLYYTKRANLDEEFELALFKEYGVEDNPKREKCFQLAWERGHSSGYNEVEIQFSEIVELIK